MNGRVCECVYALINASVNVLEKVGAQMRTSAYTRRSIKPISDQRKSGVAIIGLLRYEHMKSYKELTLQ